MSAGADKPAFCLAVDDDFEADWPFVHKRLTERLTDAVELVRVEIPRGAMVGDMADLTRVSGLCLSRVAFTPYCLAGAPALRYLAAWTDRTGRGLPLAELEERGVTVVDPGAGWAQSVAELGLGLAIDVLRRVSWWHGRMTAGERLWEYEAVQFCDDRRFVNGALGTKLVGVVGLGAIGGRLASWCRMLGARVLAYDPFQPPEAVTRLGAEAIEMDALCERSEVLFVAVPPTPSARRLLNRERLGSMRCGAAVICVTRAHAVDMEAFRERAVAGELCGGFDVFDVEPLPTDDPLRTLPHVVLTPHIAGRTRCANRAAADIIADGFLDVLAGRPVEGRLTAREVAIRTRADATEGLAAL